MRVDVFRVVWALTKTTFLQVMWGRNLFFQTENQYPHTTCWIINYLLLVHFKWKLYHIQSFHLSVSIFPGSLFWSIWQCHTLLIAIILYYVLINSRARPLFSNFFLGCLKSILNFFIKKLNFKVYWFIYFLMSVSSLCTAFQYLQCPTLLFHLSFCLVIE